MSRFVAVDWGTTNRRVFVIEDGRVLSVERDGLGALTVPPGGYPAEVARLRDRHGADLALLAGMVGSDRGWTDAGYLPAPAALGGLAARAVRPVAGAAILPGMSFADGARADVMRGEEVQLLGIADPAGGERLVCLPGTHNKWARLSGDRVERFATAMTGELYAILKAHALIGQEMAGEAADDADFAAGLAEAGRNGGGGGDLLGSLFGVRAARVLGLRAGGGASFVSGLLIGTDAGAHVRPGDQVTLAARGLLAALYARAVEGLGGTVEIVDSEDAFAAGAARAMETLA